MTDSILKDKFQKNHPKRYKYTSFTLLETIIAVSVMSIFILEVAQIQGGGIYFYEYGRNAVKASWLAKRVMSQIEYQWKQKDIKDLETETKETAFKDEPEFKYSITIKEWELPIFELMGGKNKDKDNDSNSSSSGQDNPMSAMGSSSMVKDTFSSIMDGSILKVANVKVSWPEGAKSNDVSLTLLLPNQKRLDEYMSTLKNTYDAVINEGTTP